MTTKIEQIMAMGLRRHKLGANLSEQIECDTESLSWRQAIADMRAILTALDAAGLAVVSKEEVARAILDEEKETA